MRKIIVIAIFSGLFLTGCTWLGSGNACGKLIERNKMIDILTDVFMLEAHLSQHQSFAGPRDSVAYYYAGIFDKYDITSQEFEEAYNCYLLDQDNMTLMLDEVLSSISIIQSRMVEKKPELSDSLSPALPDSLPVEEPLLQEETEKPANPEEQEQ